MKKITTASILATLTAFAFVIAALAGSTFDIGLVEGTPPAAEVNWTAWINESKNILSGGMPNEIMTEDNTASDIEENLGYSQYDSDPEIEWILQVENFSSEVHGDDISMIFGGLGPSSGKLWSLSFVWDQLTNYETDHGLVPLSSTTRACPVISDLLISGSSITLTFSGEANKTYHIYKSTQASGAGNNASNGRYLYLNSAATNALGVGTYTDNETLESWYLVIVANSANGSLDGCHSEVSIPTALTMVDFYAFVQNTTPSPSVLLLWNTLNEQDLLGFNIYRSKEAAGIRQKVNSVVLPAINPGSLEGNSYQYTDSQVLVGETWFYWVDAVKQSGSPEWLGPQAITIDYILHLPLVSHP